MACTSPLKAYRAPGGGISFSPRQGWVDRHIDLPCRQCIDCKLQRSREWATRCMHEASLHAANSFITLTFDDEHYPDDGSLDVRHWQLFAKRLRKRAGRFRYFMCGEYGDTNGRPHYHALLFGLDFPKDKIVQRRPHQLWTSRMLTEVWGQGLANVGELTYESAAYCARYVMKKVTGPNAQDHYIEVNPFTGEVHHIRPEFCSMSRGGRGGQGGIGKRWLEKFHDDVYPHDQVVLEGRKSRPPRYYDSQLPEEELAALKVKRRKNILSRSEDLTPERLAVREMVSAARASAFVRSL